MSRRLLPSAVTTAALAALVTAAPLAAAAPGSVPLGSLTPAGAGTSSAGSSGSAGAAGDAPATGSGGGQSSGSSQLSSASAAADSSTPSGSTLSSGSVYPAPMVPGIGESGVGSVLGYAIALGGGSLQITDEAPGSLDLGVGSLRVNLLTATGTLVGYAGGWFTDLQARVDAGQPLPESAMVVFANSPNVRAYQEQALAFQAGRGPFPTALTTTEQQEASQADAEGTAPAAEVRPAADAERPAGARPSLREAALPPLPAGGDRTHGTAAGAAPAAHAAAPANPAAAQSPTGTGAGAAQLASTGADVAVAAGLALGLVVTGAGALALSRRRS